MKVVLDFIPDPAWDRRYTDREAAELTEVDISLDALLAQLVFKVCDRDLSWRESIPMLDYARSFFIAVSTLSVSNREAVFISPGLAPRTWLQLADDDLVLVRRDEMATVAKVPRPLLLRATAALGLKAFHVFLAAYPTARSSREFMDWYPLAPMALAGESVPSP